ncbi:MAG: xanthine dehydrogenase family protein molybdopterin-binding subunit [Trueperaceae bacterium]|nr:xanthine dehydrogenase family protein molybdopterin-binding subunit [Trueperaceae bacterium]
MPETLPAVLQTFPLLKSWLRINADNTLSMFPGKVELGQGIRTALAQIVAEELELPLSSIRIPEVSTEHSPDEGYTAGSASLEQSGLALRLAAAQLRESLKEAAALRYETDTANIQLKDGKLWQQGKLLGSYGEVKDWLEPNQTITGRVKPKDCNSYTLIGQAKPRSDIPAKVKGEASFLHDLQFPAMVHGRVMRPSQYGARLKSLDTRELELPGLIKLERKGNFVGIIAKEEFQAVKALEKLAQRATWETNPLPNFTMLHNHLQTLATEELTVREGKPEQHFKMAKTRLEASYTLPYQAHASVAPSCAIALLDNEQLTVWTHSQGIYPLRRELAKLLNWPEEKLTLIHKDGPGCYGHNGADDVAADAALLALTLPGKAVRVLWSLEQELQNEPYTPAMLLNLKAGLDEGGKINAWEFTGLTDSHVGRPGGQGDRLRAGWEIANAPYKAKWSGPSEGGYRNAETLYRLGEARVRTRFYQGPLRVSALRTLGAFANTFANESFIDELAYATQTDPVAFRLNHLEDERAKAVIRLAAKRANWQTRTQASGKGQGIAFARYKNAKAYVAQVVELSLNAETAEISIELVTTVCDAGQIINPDGLKNQLEGGTLQGISRTLFEEIKLDWDGGGMHDWDSYSVIGFKDIPEIETFLISEPDSPILGAGEASTPPMGAAIANALFDASGIRMRDLPLSPTRIRQRLANMTDEELVKVILS